MFIERLKLNNFRNYKTLDVSFGRGINVLYGNNAQGKTNILESIYLCASARSHRTSKDTELLKFGESFFKISLFFHKNNDLRTIDLQFSQQEKKKIRVNEILLKKMGELMGHLNCVIFSPEDLLMVKEGPQERRKFMDIAISQLKPTYFYNLQQYHRLIDQRNNLLKELQKEEKPSLMDTLEVWDQGLIDAGSRIIKERAVFISRLCLVASKVHEKISGKSEQFLLRYQPSFSIPSDETNDLSAIKDMYSSSLKKALQKDLFRGTTSIGPHRDDFEILINGTDVRLFGSQGQQRTAVLSLRLSEAAFMYETTSEPPILLLDDVMSELDPGRQQRILEFCGDMQTFVTCTDKSLLAISRAEEMRSIRVELGQVYLEDM